MKKIIYRIALNPRYGYDVEGSNVFYEVNTSLNENEYYLFREVWRLNDYDLNNMYQDKIDDDFIKIVDNDWIKKHTICQNCIEYYGCEVLKDFESYEDYESCIPTQYDKEVNGL